MLSKVITKVLSGVFILEYFTTTLIMPLLHGKITNYPQQRISILLR